MKESERTVRDARQRRYSEISESWRNSSSELIVWEIHFSPNHAKINKLNSSSVLNFDTNCVRLHLHLCTIDYVGKVFGHQLQTNVKILQKVDEQQKYIYNYSNTTYKETK